MEETTFTLALAAFVAAVAGTLIYLWRKSVALRDALDGQDGHRLMVIFSRLFLVGALTTSLGVVRWLSLAIWPEAEWVRQVIGIFNSTLFLGVNLWALLAIRAIVESGRMRQQ